MAVPSTAALLEEVSSRSGNNARAATGADAVDGVIPRLVAEPVDGDTIAATLAWAASERLRVLIAGGRTKLAWGTPTGPIDLLLSTSRMHAVVAHRHGDLTATVEAGATLASVNASLGAKGQWIPWDPPWSSRATIGGIVATNDSGPRRHLSGAPRDSIIGMTMARADGALAKAGGIVVKNVAGYDLSRLLNGSFGCLGVVVTATFKLAPRPPASRTVTVELATLEAAAPVIRDVMAVSLTPTAVEVASPPARVLLRFESVEEATVEQANAALRLVGQYGPARLVAGDEEAAAWRDHARHWEADGTLIKLSTLPAELVPTLEWVEQATSRAGLELSLAGRGGLGVVDLRLQGPLEAQARLVTDLRARLPIGRGSAVIRRAEPALRQRVDAWGPIGDSLRVMQAVKRRFDPAGLLNAGRGPGGL